MFRRNLLAGVCLLAAFASVPVRAEDARDGVHFVYTMSNAAAANSVVVYRQSWDGSLNLLGHAPTGGKGTGAGLGSQGSLALTNSHRWLLTVNAGSNDVSVFGVSDEGLSLASKTPSGGQTPISLAVSGRIVYVLNAGAPNNITGFTLANDGSLTPIANSTQPLSTASAGPAEVQFSPDGDRLVVTEKATNLIDVFPVTWGVAGPPVISPSNGVTPYGFAFSKHDRLFVAEAFGGAASASAVSSYNVKPNEMLQVISGSVPTTQTAACWLVVNPAGTFAYTANTGSMTVSVFAIGPNGSLTLGGSLGSTPAGSAIDLSFSGAGRFLNALTENNATIVTFRIQPDGSLQSVGTVPAPPSAAGLVAQ
jgi:6-phosphogluconolactonase